MLLKPTNLAALNGRHVTGGAAACVTAVLRDLQQVVPGDGHTPSSVQEYLDAVVLELSDQPVEDLEQQFAAAQEAEQREAAAQYQHDLHEDPWSLIDGAVDDGGGMLGEDYEKLLATLAFEEEQAAAAGATTAAAAIDRAVAPVGKPRDHPLLPPR